MGILSSLFSSKNLIDNISDGIDAAIYTDEEKVKDRKELLKLYEPFKLAQRGLSIVFCVPYVLAWLATFLMSFTEYDTTTQVALLSGDMSKIVLAIVGFYFLGGVLNGIGKK